MKTFLVVAFTLPALSSAFFFGNSGCGCQSAAPACPPPAPAPLCPQPSPCQPSSCGGGYAVAQPVYTPVQSVYQPLPSVGSYAPQPLPSVGSYAPPPPPQPQYLPQPAPLPQAPVPEYAQPAVPPVAVVDNSYQEIKSGAAPQQVVVTQITQEAPAEHPAEIVQTEVHEIAPIAPHYDAPVAASAAAAASKRAEVVEEIVGEDTPVKAVEQPVVEKEQAKESGEDSMTEEKIVDISELKLIDDPLCNSDDLRNLMLENMDNNLNSSKRLIQLAAEAQFGGRFDVICANGDFSYVTNTELYCQETKGDISCYTYRQL